LVRTLPRQSLESYTVTGQFPPPPRKITRTRVYIYVYIRMPLYFHEMPVFQPSGLKTLNSSTLADISGLIRTVEAGYFPVSAQSWSKTGSVRRWASIRYELGEKRRKGEESHLKLRLNNKPLAWQL